MKTKSEKAKSSTRFKPGTKGKLVIDRFDSLRKLLLILPFMMTALWWFCDFALPNANCVPYLCGSLLMISLVLPMIKSAWIFDPLSREVRQEIGLVFYSFNTRHRYAFSEIKRLKLRRWQAEGSYQTSTGNWIPTLTTFHQLSFETLDSSVVLETLEDADLARANTDTLASLIGLSLQADWNEVDAIMKRNKDYDRDVILWS